VRLKCAEAVDKELPAGEIEARKAIHEKKTRERERERERERDGVHEF